MHPRATVNAVVALADQGLTASQIAPRIGVPRSTVREWLARPVVSSASESPAAPCVRCGKDGGHRLEELGGSYAYLLGLYLGDGCLAGHARGVYKLRIALDVKYPGIIEECVAAIRIAVPGNKVNRSTRPQNYVEVYSYSKAWPCLFPQHGPGKKHQRTIILSPWQQAIVDAHPAALLRGLIHSDGCRFQNTGRGGWSCPRYGFSNLSVEIKQIFCDACDNLGLRWTRAGPKTVYVSRKADVALLDRYIGPKR